MCSCRPIDNYPLRSKKNQHILGQQIWTKTYPDLLSWDADSDQSAAATCGTDKQACLLDKTDFCVPVWYSSRSQIHGRFVFCMLNNNGLKF